MTNFLYFVLVYMAIGIFIDAVLRPTRNITHITFFWLPVGVKLLFVLLIDITKIRKLFKQNPRIVQSETIL